MKDWQRVRVSELRREKQRLDPNMTNRGSSFVKILMCVTQGPEPNEATKRSKALGEKSPKGSPKRAWFPKGSGDAESIVKTNATAHHLAGQQLQPGHPMLLSPQSDPIDPDSATYLAVTTIQNIDQRKKPTLFDEPVRIAFATNRKANVALSSTNRIAISSWMAGLRRT